MVCDSVGHFLMRWTENVLQSVGTHMCVRVIIPVAHVVTINSEMEITSARVILGTNGRRVNLRHEDSHVEHRV